MYLHRNLFPKNIFMYWHQGCANTGTMSIQRAGAKVRIHISKIIPQKYFPVFAFMRIQAPHVFAQKLIPQEFFPACIGFVPGGTLYHTYRLSYTCGTVSVFSQPSPQHPEFPQQFLGSLHSNFGDSGSGCPVAGQGNRNQRVC